MIHLNPSQFISYYTCLFFNLLWFIWSLPISQSYILNCKWAAEGIDYWEAYLHLPWRNQADGNVAQNAFTLKEMPTNTSKWRRFWALSGVRTENASRLDANDEARLQRLIKFWYIIHCFRRNSFINSFKSVYTIFGSQQHLIIELNVCFCAAYR